MHTIGIDVGSTNVKAVLVGAEGAVRATSSRAVPWTPQGRVAELDAELLWDAVVASLLALSREVAGELAEVGAIGLCGQYSSIVPVDAGLRPLAPMRLYLDQRGTRHCQAILEHLPDAVVTWMERHPIPPIGGGLALGHLLGFQLDEPEIHGATAHYLEPVDYVTARLTGRVTATQGSMFASQLVDNRLLDRRSYDEDLLASSGVDPSRLPPLIGADEVIGALHPSVAEVVGLDPSVVVVAGMTDTHAAALATGAGTTGRAGVSIGTTAVVLTTTDRLHADFDHEVLAMPGIVADEYLVWAENGLAGRVVEHVLRDFVYAEDVLGAHAVRDPFVGLDAALAASLPGAHGVLFLPWLSGSMAPAADGTMRGGFVGVSLDARRVDLVRAAVEGVVHNLRTLVTPVEAFSAERIEEIVLVGGAARSTGWCQVVADVLGRPVRTVVEPDRAGARAAAAWAGRAAGSARVVDPVAGPGLGSTWGELYVPDPGACKVHDSAHQRFTASFDALRPLRLGRPAPTA